MDIQTILSRPGAGLAPMAGVTDMPFRLLCRELGAAWAVTEMLSAKGLVMGGENRAAGEILARDPTERPLGLQLFGHEPLVMAEAARRLQGRFDFIDINMGCPAHKIVKGGDGAALMKAPLLAGKIIEEVVRAVPCPVTVKLRAGWDEGHKNGLELCRIAQEAGAAAVTLHARTREQFYAGAADWDLIGEAASTLSIPVIGNGDIKNGEDALSCLGKAGCSGIMVGRAAQGNPWVFRDILCALRGEPYAPPSIPERAALCIRHLDMACAFRGERSAVLAMRRHAAWYLAGIPNGAKIRTRINLMTEAKKLRALLQEIAGCPQEG